MRGRSLGKTGPPATRASPGKAGGYKETTTTLRPPPTLSGPPATTEGGTADRAVLFCT